MISDVTEHFVIKSCHFKKLLSPDLPGLLTTKNFLHDQTYKYFKQASSALTKRKQTQNKDMTSHRRMVPFLTLSEPVHFYMPLIDNRICIFWCLPQSVMMHFSHGRATEQVADTRHDKTLNLQPRTECWSQMGNFMLPTAIVIIFKTTFCPALCVLWGRTRRLCSNVNMTRCILVV